MTIVVDGYKSEHQASTQSTEWRLPSTDPRDEGKYLFRLHTLDIYFWVKEDATLFVQHCQHTLQPQQVELDYPVTEPHTNLTSPVVQKLENMAVSDPAYNNAGHSIGKNTSSAQLSSPAPDQNNASRSTPLAYNPAAPAAPEKRAHREKTPPPPEEPGVGLAHAASEDHMHQSNFLPGDGPSNTEHHQAYAGNPYIPHNYTPSPSQSVLSSPPSKSTAATPHSYMPASKESNAVPSGQSAMDSPTVQILGQSYLTSPTVPLQHLHPQYPDYLAQRQSTSPAQDSHTSQPYSPADHHYRPGNYYPTSTGDTNIHSQVYIPTEGEGHGKTPKPGSAGPGAASPGKWEQKAEKAEKGLNRLLRKVEKKIG